MLHLAVKISLTNEERSALIEASKILDNVMDELDYAIANYGNLADSADCDSIDLIKSICDSASKIQNSVKWF